MVFTSLVRFGKNLKGGPRGPDRFWKRRKVLRMSAHFYGRRRQCYTVAIRYVQRAMKYVTKARKLKQKDAALTWDQRLTAACSEHGLDYTAFRQGLRRLDILLNRKVLTDMAVFEPRTFKALANLAKSVALEEGLNGINSLSSSPPPGVYTRHMLKNK